MLVFCETRINDVALKLFYFFMAYPFLSFRILQQWILFYNMNLYTFFCWLCTLKYTILFFGGFL